MDAFGGDNAPDEVIKGAVLAVKEYGVNIVLCGDEKQVNERIKALGVSTQNITVKNADGVIRIEDNPTNIRKAKLNSSMGVAFQLVKNGEADAFISGGSTAALVVGGTTLIGRIKGVKRAALAPIMPTAKGHMILVDGGANVDCRPEMLVQFGVMGSCYMNRVMGISKPKVGLVNVGSEDTKGRELEIEAYKQFRNAPVDFYGNLEAREVPFGACEVVVSDGFTGNVLLKLYEGMGSYFSHTLKDMLTSNLGGKIAALMIMPKIKEFRKKMDYKEVGGAVLLGISKPVIKAHGSSDGKAFYNAIRQAKNCVDGKIIEEITSSLANIEKT